MLEVGQPIIYALVLDADNQAGLMLDDNSQVEQALVLDRNNHEGHICLDAMIDNQVGLMLDANSQVGHMPGCYCKQPSRSQALWLDA